MVFRMPSAPGVWGGPQTDVFVVLSRNRTVPAKTKVHVIPGRVLLLIQLLLRILPSSDFGEILSVFRALGEFTVVEEGLWTHCR